jgi:hypothetical protein
MRFGPLVQGATVRYGSGRVAAFTDSTVFSNFWMFMPGKPTLAVSYVDWLNRENAVPYPGALGLLLAVLLAVPLGFLYRHIGRGGLVLAVAAGLLLAVPVGLRVYGMADRLAYPTPEPRSDFTQIAFEQEYSDLVVPATLEGFKAGPEGSLHTFYVWTQRLGYVPSLEGSLEDAVECGDVVVIVDPTEPPGPGDAGLLEQYVEGGGRLLVLGSGAGDSDALRGFLDPFGLGVSAEPLRSPAVLANRAATSTIRFTDTAGGALGGTPLLSTAAGDDVCTHVDYGDGIVVLVSDSGLFRDASMGGVNAVPDGRLRQIADVEYGLLRLLAEGQRLDL